MTELVQHLTRTLEGVTQLYQKLRIVLDRKQAAIVSGKTDAVSECSATEERLVELAQVLNDNRIGIMQTLAARLGLSKSDATLRQVAERIGDPYGAQLMAMKAELVALIEKVGEINRANALLIKDSLGFINDVLTTAFVRPNGKPSRMPAVYGQRGLLDPVRIDSGLVNLRA